jgi:hypothetical protein
MDKSIDTGFVEIYFPPIMHFPQGTKDPTRTYGGDNWLRETHGCFSITTLPIRIRSFKSNSMQIVFAA